MSGPLPTVGFSIAGVRPARQNASRTATTPGAAGEQDTDPLAPCEP